MELANNAIEVAREGIEFRNILVDGIEPNTKCRQAYAQLRDCVLTNKLNIFDKDGNRQLKQPSDRLANWTSGTMNAPEPFAAITSKYSIERAWVRDFTPRIS